MEQSLVVKKPKKSIKESFKSFRFKVGDDADIDWKVLSIAFFILVFCVFVINAFLFVHFVLLTNKSEEKTASVELVDRQKLVNIITLYRERSVKFEEIRKKQAPVIPPSAPIDPSKKPDIVEP